MACQSSSGDVVALYNVGSNTFALDASWSTGSTDSLRGVRFYPSQPTYAFATISSISNHILSITSSSISSLYSVSESDTTYSCDISSTSSFVIIAASSYLKIYTLTTSTISNTVR